jgi:hypothetical protein
MMHRAKHLGDHMAEKGLRIRTATPKKTTRKKVTAKRARRSSTVAGRQRLRVTIAKLIFPGDQIQAENLRSAKSVTRRKRIHRRKVNRDLPRDKLLVGDAYPKPPIAFDAASSPEPMAAAPAKAATGITIHWKHQFVNEVPANVAYHVCEPSVAINDKVLFVTGNKFVLQSSDGGETFKFNHPSHIFETHLPIHGDQVTLYSPNLTVSFGFCNILRMIMVKTFSALHLRHRQTFLRKSGATLILGRRPHSECADRCWIFPIWRSPITSFM